MWWAAYKTGDIAFQLFGARIVEMPKNLTWAFLVDEFTHHPMDLMVPWITGGFILMALSWPVFLYFMLSHRGQAAQKISPRPSASGKARHMIIGTGNDLIDIRRIEKTITRFGLRFIERCFAPVEIEKAERRRAAGTHIATYAKRFAAKEACSKALGTGFNHGVHMRDIAVTNDSSGKPSLILSGGALARLKAT